jgi:excisionase family DNA binding protein
VWLLCCVSGDVARGRRIWFSLRSCHLFWASHGTDAKLRGEEVARPISSIGGFSYFRSVMDEANGWMSTAEVADYLGVQPRTLYRFIDEGRLPAYRFGRVIRVKRHDVEVFIQSCRIEPGMRIDTSSISSTTA